MRTRLRPPGPGRFPWFRLTLIGLAVALAFAPIPERWVESLYSRGLYLVIERHVTPLSNAFSWSLLDVLIVVGLAVLGIAWSVALARAPRGRRLRRAADLLLSTAAAAACLYLVFLVNWGLNYRRVPLVDKLVYEPGLITPGAQRALVAEAVDALNHLYDARTSGVYPSIGQLPPTLASAFQSVQDELGIARAARPAIPKRTLLQPYFMRAAVDGMTDPFLLETLVDDRLLPFERPFVIAHEWAHLAGYADESEANFIGWLTCLRSSPADQYSGWQFLYEQALVGLPAADRAAADHQLGDGPRRDLIAVRNRVLRGLSPWVQQAGWRLYDRYLKANNVAAGIGSYDAVIRLVLGTKFGPDWRPIVKPYPGSSPGPPLTTRRSRGTARSASIAVRAGASQAGPDFSLGF